MNRLAMSLLPAAALLASLPATAADPPPATLAQLEKALKHADPASVSRPMKSTMRAVVAKPSGGDREEVVAESVGRGDGTATGTLVYASKDGKDVTAEKRAEAEKEKAEKAKRDAARAKKPLPKKDELGLGLKIPAGSDRALFVFGDPKSEGGLLVAEYEPVRGAKGDSLSRGRIAWNAATGEPAFLEAQLVNPPTGLKELHLRGDFADAGDAIYTRLMKTTGVGGILWIKRKFEITVEMAPVPAP